MNGRTLPLVAMGDNRIGKIGSFAELALIVPLATQWGTASRPVIAMLETDKVFAGSIPENYDRA